MEGGRLFSPEPFWKTQAVLMVRDMTQEVRDKESGLN